MIKRKRAREMPAVIRKAEKALRIAGDQALIVNGQKQGGNVASYFCTPDGRVLDVVAGPVDAKALLSEARWAVEARKMALLESGSDDTRLRAFFQSAHAERKRHDTRSYCRLELC